MKRKAKKKAFRFWASPLRIPGHAPEQGVVNSSSCVVGNFLLWKRWHGIPYRYRGGGGCVPE